MACRHCTTNGGWLHTMSLSHAAVAMHLQLSCVDQDVSRWRAGIGYSDDKLLQWRLMAYDDTQRYRIGPNFGFLPVNAPRCPVHNNRQDGPLNNANQTGAVNYYPSDFATQVRPLVQGVPG